MVTKADLDAMLSRLLGLPEGERFETKRLSGKMVQKALETICAFSNTHGGVLLMGVEDAKKASGVDRLFGLSENSECLAELKRKLLTHFVPSIRPPIFLPFSVKNRKGSPYQVIAMRVYPSTKVHTILDDGTWIRVESTNREMSAAEITNLSYRRGVCSAEGDLVGIELSLLNTDSLKLYCDQRGIAPEGTLQQRLTKIGLGRMEGRDFRPTRAAVLLFADSPTDLLAPAGSRAGVRIFRYSGTAIDRSENPNLLKPPKNFSAPLFKQIEQARHTCWMRSHADSQWLLLDLKAGMPTRRE